MKHLRLLSLFTILILALSPLAVFAQDSTEMKTFTSNDGNLTLSYPADWFAQDATETTMLPSAIIANSEEASASMLSSLESFASGDQGIVIMLMPTQLLSMAGLDLAEDASITEMGQVIAGFFTGTTPEDSGETAEATPSPEATESGAVQLGAVEEIELGENLTAAYIPMTQEGIDGAMVIYPLKEGLVALLVAGAYPGEFDEQFNTTLRDIAATIEYAGTADDVMNGFLSGMGGPVGTEQPSDGATSSTLDGNALVNERCTKCHTRERIDAEDMDEAGWTETVDEMIEKGAQLNPDERQAVIDYLVATH